MNSSNHQQSFRSLWRQAQTSNQTHGSTSNGMARSGSFTTLTHSQRGIKARFCRMQIPDAVATALSKAHTDSSTRVNKLFSDTEVQDLIGIEAYCDLKRCLTGQIAEVTRMSMARVDDGFFVGLEHGFSTSESPGSPGVDGGARAGNHFDDDANDTPVFACEALISVHKSQLMSRTISELYVPSAVLNICVHQDSVHDTIQTLTRVHLRNDHMSPNASEASPFKSRTTQQHAGSKTVTTNCNVRLLVHENDDDRRPLVEVPLQQQQLVHATLSDARTQTPVAVATGEAAAASSAFKIDIVLAMPNKSASASKQGKLDMQTVAGTSTTSCATLIIPDVALQTMSTHTKSQVIGPKAGLQVALEGQKVTMICACPLGGNDAKGGKFSSFEDSNNVTERFTAYVSLFPTCIQEHKNSTYIHGARALIARVMETACSNGALISQPVTEPPEFYPLAASNPAIACALIRSLNLQTARPVEDEHLAHVFEMLGVTVQSSTTSLPVNWASAGPISTFSLPGAQKMLHSLKKAANTAQLIANTMIKLRPLFNAKKVSITKMAIILKAAYTAFRVHNSIHSPVFLNHPNPSPSEKEFYSFCLQDFDRRFLKLDTSYVMWDGEQINVYYMSNEMGVAFIFKHMEQIFALGAYIINGHGVSSAAAGPDAQSDALLASMEQLKTAMMQTSTDEADHKIQLAQSNGEIPGLQQPTLRGAAMRLAYIDTLYTNHPVFEPFARTLRAVWLHTEQQNLLNQIIALSNPSDSPETMLDNRRLYYHCIHQLKEMASLPLGCNYWSTVPYY